MKFVVNRQDVKYLRLTVHGDLPYKNLLVSPVDMAVEPDMTEGAPTSECLLPVEPP